MILEVADLRIEIDRQGEFEKAVHLAMTTIFPRAKGFKGHQLYHCIETPNRYILQLSWDTLEDHTVGFRQSPLFTEWRALVGDFFSQAPQVEHFERPNALNSR
jgi:heme-degrading monooxygenase HmoA